MIFTTGGYYVPVVTAGRFSDAPGSIYRSILSSCRYYLEDSDYRSILVDIGTIVHCGDFSTGFLDMWTPDPQTQETNRKTKGNCFQNKHFPFSKKYIVGISWQFFMQIYFFVQPIL